MCLQMNISDQDAIDVEDIDYTIVHVNLNLYPTLSLSVSLSVVHVCRSQQYTLHYVDHGIATQQNTLHILILVVKVFVLKYIFQNI